MSKDMTQQVAMSPLPDAAWGDDLFAFCKKRASLYSQASQLDMVWAKAIQQYLHQTKTPDIHLWGFFNLVISF